MAPIPTSIAGQNPPIIPLLIISSLIGPIGAAKLMPRTIGFTIKSRLSISFIRLSIPCPLSVFRQGAFIVYKFFSCIINSKFKWFGWIKST
jgi:hypothetical protein